MSTLTVKYLGANVGTLAETRGGIVFEYDRAFLSAAQELSPLMLPLRPGVQSRMGGRLPGLFDDSLPDVWGRRVMHEWFRQHGTPAHAVTPILMLAYVGSRGMGALAYEPERALGDAPGSVVSLSALQDAALRAEAVGAIDLNAFAALGSSAGGARPKALIALPRMAGGLVLSGVGDLPSTHEAWLVKFDTSIDGSHGPMEEAYAGMSRAAGIDFPRTKLLPTEHDGKPRRHFAVQRFDRDGGLRVHHHTLAAVTELGAGDLNYETYLRVTRRLTQDETEVWKAYRRAVFNVLASNRDDHGKNHGFLYRRGQWQVGPAYDLNFIAAEQQPERGMSIGGERRIVTRDHLGKLAASEGLDRRTALGIIDEVRAAVARWREFASAAEVPDLKAAEVERALHGN